MAINVFGQKIDQKLTILCTQKLKYRLRLNVPTSWINKSKSKSFPTSACYVTQSILKTTMKHMNFKTVMRFRILT